MNNKNYVGPITLKKTFVNILLYSSKYLSMPIYPYF